MKIIKIGIPIACLFFVGCHTTNVEEVYTLVQNEKQLMYSVEGTPIDPLTLVTIAKENSEEPMIESAYEVVCEPKYIDDSLVGNTVVTYIVTNKTNHQSQSFQAKFYIVNEQGPKIKVLNRMKTLTVGDNFDPESVIIDAYDLKLVEEAPKVKKDGTYAEGWYTITSNVKPNKAGSYSVAIHAVSKNGLFVDKKVSVTVVPKKALPKNDPKYDSRPTPEPTSTPEISEQTCREVYHDVEKHKEIQNQQVWIVDQEGYEETVFSCECGAAFSDEATWNTHALDTGHTNYSKDVVMHEASGHYENQQIEKWVIDKEAWSETICE